MSWNNIHPNFKMNGQSFSKEELIVLTNSFINSDLEYKQESGQFILNWLDDHDFVQVQTSGTTGKPKLIKVAKQAMVNSAIATGDFLHLTAGDTALCCLPVKYIAGKMMLVRSMVLGLELDLVEPQSDPLKNNSKNYDFVAMVPLQVEHSINQLNQIKKLIIGGANVNKALEKQLLNIAGEIYESYSMTETVTHIALKQIGEQVFTVLPNVTISVDQRNCLVIDAPNLNPDKIVTNDVVSKISETTFIWKGRIDHVINSGGIKLFPEEIEKKLSEKMTSRFFITGIPDEKWGEKVVLVVEGEEFLVNETIFDVLDKYEKPKAIYFLPKFLETETGKIKRKEIRNTL